ncbi:c-type cytochrome [Thiomicrospira sp. ALE5]|uniref:c-type cytochrome n=1 Tax=Thiomicrospira sp. ALE5 TaxID=748650 RepID=UPI0008E2487A|nr:c-type cytochrome [Thiomicrospira sp. ALE5]SFR54408.1 Cytochrome c553 [Thiomicrospira sp. ALE5]
MKTQFKTFSMSALTAGLALALAGCGQSDAPSSANDKMTTQSESAAQLSATSHDDTLDLTRISAVAQTLQDRPTPWTDARLRDALTALPEGDEIRGERVANQFLCIACHSVEGEFRSHTYVNLNAQPENYLRKVLLDYRHNHRAEPYGQAKIMHYLSKELTDQHISDLARYYAAQQPLVNTTSTVSIESSTEQLVTTGDMSRMIISCAACHGAQGEGNGDTFPALAGQAVDYTIRTLKAYRDGSRNNDVNAAMRNVAQNLTDDEIEQLAHYYAQIGQ